MTNTPASLIVDMLRQSLEQDEMPFLTISSGSMAPLLKTGDQVGLEAAEAARLKPGDIVTLATERDLLTHRFWGWEDGRLRTRGDRPILFDPLWPPDCLLGKVVMRKRNGRSLSLTSGWGKRLNRHLARLIIAEVHFLDKKWLIRLIHRANFIWASFVAAIVK
ncbi:MAG: hypothetical protein GY803_17145 [Chloroflexi bacterium]|nr:hypothetical protein [Chloroflexota bacterium]